LLRTSVIDDHVINEKIVSDIRTQLFSFQQRFLRIFRKEDKSRLKGTLDMLQLPVAQIEVNALCEQLDYFIARFERKETRT